MDAFTTFWAGTWGDDSKYITAWMTEIENRMEKIESVKELKVTCRE
jgi:hypothetical protein